MVLDKVVNIMITFYSNTISNDNNLLSNHYKEQIRYPLNRGISLGYINAKEESIILEAIHKFDLLFNVNTLCLVHNDLHFDNILYNNGDITVIDFERSMYATIDKELDILGRMCRFPKKYASEENEMLVFEEDFSFVTSYMEDKYKSLFDTKYLELRLSAYDLMDAIGMITSFPKETGLKEIVLSSANYIIGNI